MDGLERDLEPDPGGRTATWWCRSSIATSTWRGRRRGWSGRGQPIVLVEGNYLLLDEAPWDGLARFFDRTLFLDVPVPELRRRLVDRWHGYGREPEAAAAWAEATTCRTRRRWRSGRGRRTWWWTTFEGGFGRRSVAAVGGCATGEHPPPACSLTTSVRGGVCRQGPVIAGLRGSRIH